MNLEKKIEEIISSYTGCKSFTLLHTSKIFIADIAKAIASRLVVDEERIRQQINGWNIKYSLSPFVNQEKHDKFIMEVVNCIANADVITVRENGS